MASEHETLFSEGARAAAAIASFGEMPLVAIGAGRPNPAFGAAAEAYQAFWNEQSRALAAKSVRGAFTLAKGSGRHIHQDAPEVVIGAIRQVLEQTRQPR